VGIAIDEEDNLWLTDVLLNRVLQFTSASTMQDVPIANLVLGEPSFNICT